jgi:hypothetical protein
VNRLLKGVRPKQMQGIFAAQNAITASPLGSPTAASPEVKPVLTWEEWLAKYARTDLKHGGRKVKAISQSQIALPY